MKKKKNLTYKERYLRSSIECYILAAIIIVVSVCIYFAKSSNNAKKQENVSASVTTTATPTQKPTPKPTPIIMVKQRYKKGKLLQEHTVYHYSSYNRDNNLKVACDMIDGTKLMPEEDFSFFGIIGEPNEEKGFLPAGVIINKKPATAIAGGICEVATSLNTSIVDVGIKTNARNHSTNVGYLNETDHEATVTYDGGIDLKFRNTLNFPILIKMKAIGGNVRTRLFKMNKIYIVRIKNQVTGKVKIKKYTEKNMPEKYKQFIPEY